MSFLKEIDFEDPFRILHRAPFVRLLFPLVTGILVSEWLQNDTIYITIILIALLFLFLQIIRKRYRWNESMWGTGLFLLIFLLGMSRSAEQSYHKISIDSDDCFGIIEEYPSEKQNSFRTIIRLTASNQKILTYLEKSDRIDSLMPGSLIHFEAEPEVIENWGVPFEFDYKKYLLDRSIGYRIFLRKYQYQLIHAEPILSLSTYALILRNKLLSVYKTIGMDEESQSLIASISFGDRDDVDKETIKSFTNTGVIHILAVSGMNVGLIYLIITFIFGFLKKSYLGKLIYYLLSLIAIWGYALITGLSPSILRAAMMLTFVIIGSALKRESFIYNTLAVSAFLLILWKPILIHDVGFQLSYIAVLSIVAIQPFVYRQLYFKYYLLDKIWLILSVTIAAQVGTLPLTITYFHQFPIYFWLANLFVIPLVSIVLYLSFAVLFVYFLSPFLAGYLSIVLDWSIKIILVIVRHVEKFPNAIIQSLYPSLSELIIVCFLVVVVLVFFKFRSLFLLNIVLTVLILLATILNYNNYTIIKREELVFFKVRDCRVLLLTMGRETTCLTSPSKVELSAIKNAIGSYLAKRKIKKSSFSILSDSLNLNTESIKVRGYHIWFSGIRIQIINNPSTVNFQTTPKADIFWLPVSSSLLNIQDLNSSKSSIFYSSKFEKKGINSRLISKKEVNWICDDKATFLTVNYFIEKRKNFQSVK